MIRPARALINHATAIQQTGYSTGAHILRPFVSALILPGLLLCSQSTRCFSITSATASGTADEKHAQVTYDGQLDEKLGEVVKKQKQTPWHRQGADIPPVKRPRSAGAMTKGKLLTTPSRLLKLILPVTTKDKNTDRKDVEPLALLVHPSQPLSYLERLIQSELPLITGKDGKDKVPEVHFRAEESAEDEISEGKEVEEAEEKDEASEDSVIDGKKVQTGKVLKPEEPTNPSHASGTPATAALRGSPGKGGVETYSSSSSGTPKNLVRWSSSTEIGDFIRDAARASEFAVEIEGASSQILVGVPSFDDRTHYLRVRLRKVSKNLNGLAEIKKECDEAAHKSAQRLALGGFGVMVAWWGGTYYFTFMTNYGWDTMEPITYLAGLSTIMLGYVYFLYHNREVSYRQALHMQISHKQTQLYVARGFDIHSWEALIEEANGLRKEIKGIATEYDVEWNEKQDEGSEIVHEEMRKERAKKKAKAEGDEDEEDIDGVESEAEEDENDKKREK